jgi:hypothetical protein
MKIAAAIVAVATLAGGARADTLHERLASLVARGETLYAEAEKVVEAQPTTESAAKEIAATLGKAFHHDESAYQIAFLPIVKSRAGVLSADLREGFVRVWTFDILVSQAVADATDCRGALAQHDLLLAREMLDHARLASEGRPERGWAPDATVPEDGAACR